MTDDDIPEVDEEWFKKAMLRLAHGPRFYKLVGREVVPCDEMIEGFFQRAETISKIGTDPFRVAITEVGGNRSISTVFLSLDHRHLGDGPPLVFETMIFPGAEIIGRCSTWEEAEAMHEKAVEDARKLRVVK